MLLFEPLPTDGLFLLLNTVYKRSELRIRAAVRIVKRQFIDRLYNLFGGIERKQRGNHQNENQNPENRADENERITRCAQST